MYFHIAQLETVPLLISLPVGDYIKLGGEVSHGSKKGLNPGGCIYHGVDAFIVVIKGSAYNSKERELIVQSGLQISLKPMGRWTNRNIVSPAVNLRIRERAFGLGEINDLYLKI